MAVKPDVEEVQSVYSSSPTKIEVIIQYMQNILVGPCACAGYIDEPFPLNLATAAIPKLGATRSAQLVSPLSTRLKLRTEAILIRVLGFE